ncbi:Antiviral helicase ski2 [Marasmius crinis-equi]|uniref:Antiviral helicase ski2 n=1 Tax=Marasmius crinis-equi TaxID=585013 RepID=A0ABR3FNB8_9AGAR
MNIEEQAALIDQILHPAPENASRILGRLGLANLPAREEVHREIESKLLLPQDELPSHWLPKYQVHWERDVDVPSLLPTAPSAPPTSLSFVRAGLEGRVVGYSEIPTPSTSTGLTSTSMERAPGPSTNFVRGKSGYVPFWPGGLDDVSTDPAFSLDSTLSGKRGLRTVPPGFSRGLRLPGDDAEEDELINELDELRESGESTAIDEAERGRDDLDDDEPSRLPPGNDTEIDALLPTTRSHLNPIKSSKRGRAKAQKRDWAHVIDVKTPLTNFHELVPNMARKYPFELDTFQKHAVYHLEKGDSVFVAAHTSAGKTVVAEYAIALAEQHMTRAIYTSPIKALSNQKFRDFKQTFSSASVGILTGDVQINPEASCLIMTTEILRSMLYKGADLIRDVEFVIFDEVHYVNDAERGVVWEEVIIMLPDHVNIILLSATVPNSKEFAEWVGRTKKKDIYVISTAQRPVPLEHYLYAGRDLFKIVDANRRFLGQGYKDASESLRRKQDKEREAAGLPPVQRVGARGAAPRGGRAGAPARGGRGGGAGTSTRTIHTGADKNLYVHLVSLLKKKNLLPVVVFTLSKKRCEENASTLTNQDLCTAVEKSEVHVAIEKALSRLKGSDRKLPQIARMRDLLSRGIGVHHGGLLPIVKELVEILFARGLVKILFATETFAMGVNMPAKCVVFSGIRKHDGRSFRDILPGEYTQMAGRAGRRGLDPTGTVIIVTTDSLPESEKDLLLLKKLNCDVCGPDIEEFYDLNAEIVDLNRKLVEMSSGHPQGAKSFQAGRVVVLRDGHFDKNRLAVLLKPGLPEPGSISKAKTYVVLALVNEDEKRRAKGNQYLLSQAHARFSDGPRIDKDPQAIPPRWPPKPNSLFVTNQTYELRTVPFSSIAMVTDRAVKVDVSSIVERRRISSMNEAVSFLQEVLAEWKDGPIPEVAWGKMRMLEFQEALNTRNSLVDQLEGKGCILCGNFEEHYAVIHAEKVLRANIANLKLAISDQNLELIPDYEQRIEVLKELKFIDENSTVLLKGRVACEINSANELILTELILENTLANYEPEEVVALLSCFVFQEKTDVEPVIPPKLEQGRDAIIAISEKVGRLQDRNKVAAEESRSKLNFGLAEVVYEWAKGMPFEQITALTDVPEGTIVRVITRLDETCREVRDAARVIGDADLFKKMEESQIRIKRDIVFAASLYF